MRFSLIRLFILMTMVCCLMGVVFSPPMQVCVIVMSCLHLLSPAVWITGMRYAQGRLQVFSWGGFMAGIAPWIAGIYMLVAAGFSAFQSKDIFSQDSVETRIYILLMWSSSGIIAVFGGLLALMTYQLIKPAMASTLPRENLVPPSVIPLPKFLDSHTTISDEQQFSPTRSD